MLLHIFDLNANCVHSGWPLSPSLTPMECISYFDIFDTTMAQRILQVPICPFAGTRPLAMETGDFRRLHHQRGFRNPIPTGYHTHSLPWSKKNHVTHSRPFQAHLATQNQIANYAFTRAFFGLVQIPRFVRTSSRMRTMLFRNPSLTSFLEELTMTRYTKSLPTFGIFGKQEMTTGLIIRNGP